jgi:aspartate aminotransferase-like enzyme
MGLTLFAPDSPSRALTSICVPESVDGVALVNHLRTTYGVTLAGGQNHLKGRIMRLAHLGYVNRFDTLTGLAAIGMGLNDMGHKTDIGAGINAAVNTIGQFFDYSVTT